MRLTWCVLSPSPLYIVGAEPRADVVLPSAVRVRALGRVCPAPYALDRDGGRLDACLSFSLPCTHILPLRTLSPSLFDTLNPVRTTRPSWVGTPCSSATPSSFASSASDKRLSRVWKGRRAFRRAPGRGCASRRGLPLATPRTALSLSCHLPFAYCSRRPRQAAQTRGSLSSHSPVSHGATEHASLRQRQSGRRLSRCRVAHAPRPLARVGQGLRPALARGLPARVPRLLQRVRPVDQVDRCVSSPPAPLPSSSLLPRVAGLI